MRAVILAAGQGTRMRSKLPKVLADVAGRPMISWVVDAVAGIDPGQIMVVVGHGADHVADVLPDHAGWCIQDELLGTGDAARVGLAALGSVEEDIVLILNGDAPLLTSATLADLVSMQRRTNAAVTLLTAEMSDPTGYGRVLRDERGRVVGVVEHGDAAPGQLGIREINAGMYAFRGDLLPAALDQLKADNVQGEFYLTDVISVLAEEGYSLGALRTSADEIFGVNSHDQLAEASRLMRRQIASRWMDEGVWVQDPDRTYLGPDVTLEPGVRLYPGVHLEGRTHVAAGAVVGPDVFATDTVIGGESRVWYAVLRGAVVGNECEVGPYASLRPGSILRDGSKVGTFVETKSTTVGEGSKVPHLTYLGDTQVGKNANIGAGTITCNYDGYRKSRTVVGDRAFIGSDTMLVAPVTVGDDAVTGAGSVITRDVPPGALAVERASQVDVPGYAARRRETKRAREAEEPEEA